MSDNRTLVSNCDVVLDHGYRVPVRDGVPLAVDKRRSARAGTRPRSRGTCVRANEHAAGNGLRRRRSGRGGACRS